jgi:hypothetical protein
MRVTVKREHNQTFSMVTVFFVSSDRYDSLLTGGRTVRFDESTLTKDVGQIDGTARVLSLKCWWSVSARIVSLFRIAASGASLIVAKKSRAM